MPITTFSNTIAGLSGSITVRFDLFGGSNGSNGTFRMDDFVLNGYTTAVENWSPEGYRYGFNSMEKDDEVKGGGNSYDFGARMYDSRVGRWFTRDLLANKYPSISPYVLVNNSPIIALDKDGNDWIISTSVAKDGTKTIFIKLTAAAINNSVQPVDMNAFCATVKSQVEQTFSISYMEFESKMKFSKQPGDRPDLLIPMLEMHKVNVVVDVDIRIIKDINELKSNEHLIHIEDEAVATSAAGGVSINGMANKLGGKDVLINRSSLDAMMNGTNNNTIPHEIGHTLNLRHVDQKSEGTGDVNYQYLSDHASKHKNNLMTSGRAFYKDRKVATKVEGFQIKWAIKAYEQGKLNKK
ncbi:MAG: hypothetical protein RL264_2387 [Bacteroidota bacterium]|jgi:RHS repeat-associated protein